MNIVIFGSNGMLGNYIKNYLSNKEYTLISLTRNDYDLLNIDTNGLDNFLKTFDLKQNDLIINCAGIIPQSSQDKNLCKNMYYKINTIFPIILSMICKKNNWKMIHITTDCVFSGKDGNYDEKSIHDETNDYGISKSLGELSGATIIRTSIIGEEINYKRSLLEWVKKNANKEINGYINHYWNGLTCLELSKIIEKIIIDNNYWTGVKHIFSPRTVSKYELINMINNIYNLNIKINKYSTEKIDKSLKSIYDNYKIADLYDQIIELKNFNLT